MKPEDQERKNVFKVYDEISDWFSKNRDTGLSEKKYLDELLKLIPASGEILDLGCGNGKPILQYLNDFGLKV